MDNIRINDRVIPNLLKKLEDVVVERRKEEEEEMEAKARLIRREPTAELNERFVSKEEIRSGISWNVNSLVWL